MVTGHLGVVVHRVVYSNLEKTNVKNAEKYFLDETLAIPQSTFSIPSFLADLPDTLYTCCPPPPLPPPQYTPKNGPQDTSSMFVLFKLWLDYEL